MDELTYEEQIRALEEAKRRRYSGAGGPSVERDPRLNLMPNFVTDEPYVQPKPQPYIHSQEPLDLEKMVKPMGNKSALNNLQDYRTYTPERLSQIGQAVDDQRQRDNAPGIGFVNSANQSRKDAMIASEFLPVTGDLHAGNDWDTLIRSSRGSFNKGQYADSVKQALAGIAMGGLGIAGLGATFNPMADRAIDVGRAGFKAYLRKKGLMNNLSGLQGIPEKDLVSMEEGMRKASGQTQRPKNQSALAQIEPLLDDGGNPLTVYHATDKDFETFDLSKVGARDAGYFGEGAYFTDKKDTAIEYGEDFGDEAIIKEANLSFKNPFMWDTTTPEATAKTKQALEDLGFGDVWGKYEFDEFSNLTNNKDVSRFTNKLKSEGYDGVARKGYENEYVAFNSSQISPIKPKNQSALSEITYSGQDVLDRIGAIPSAKSIVGEDTMPVGGMFSSVTSQQPLALAQHTSTRIPSAEALPPENIGIADLLGSEIHAIVGDNTGRHTVTGVGGQRFETPVDAKAGFQYTDVEGQGYAGAKSATNSKYNEAIKSDDPRYMSIQMAEQSGDFAQHTNDVYGEMFKNAPIAKADIPKVDAHIRKIGMAKTIPKKDSNGKILKKKDGSNQTRSITVRPFENFTSVADPSAVKSYLNALPSGTQRAAFIKGLDRGGMHKIGVPKVSDARLASTDPNLVGMDWGTAGYRTFKPDMKKGPYPTTLNQSTTYDTGIDKIGRSQTLTHDNKGIPANLLFSDLSAEQRAKGTGGNLVMNSPDYKVLESSPKRAKQIVTDKVVDIISNFTEIERDFGREASLKYANELLSGGKITGQMIEAAKKANAPKWVIAALTGAGLAQMSAQEEGSPNIY